MRALGFVTRENMLQFHLILRVVLKTSNQLSPLATKLLPSAQTVHAGNLEKATLYLTLGACVGVVAILTLVSLKLSCHQRHRRHDKTASTTLPGRARQKLQWIEVAYGIV